MVHIKTSHAYLYSLLAMLVGFGILLFNRWKTATTSCYPSCPESLNMMRGILIPLSEVLFLLGFIGLIGTIILSIVRFTKKLRSK
jgi:cell division protein FtsX